MIGDEGDLNANLFVHTFINVFIVKSINQDIEIKF